MPRQPAATRDADTSIYLPNGGSNPLHVADHAGVGIDDETGTALTHEIRPRAAAVVVDTYAGWYRVLHQRAAELPDLSGDRSWRIDVVCLPIGHLGTFRRSRVTGRWFTGPHRVHQCGNATATEWSFD